jgi:response regulator RpfG family c-di-GMP phosphodiesterase
MKYKVLIVDDEPANLRMLERLFRDQYDVLTAASGTEGLEVLSLHEAALIISDQRMPGMTGIQFLKRASEMRPQTVRIILTGYTDVADLVEAINSGVVYKYITKPWINSDLCQTIQRGLEYYEATKTRHVLIQENERLEIRLKTTIKGFITTVREMIAQKSANLSEHCRRTSEYAALIGTRLGLEAETLEQLIFAGLLHELPNIRIPFDMDIKKSALTPEQIRVTRNHFQSGLKLISNVPDMEDVASIICYQHERFDGSGFFDGLEGEKIPFLSRILAVANAFDDINSGRNPALFCTDEEACEWMRQRAGTGFDPQVVEACTRIRPLDTGRFIHARARDPRTSNPGAASVLR